MILKFLISTFILVPFLFTGCTSTSSSFNDEYSRDSSVKKYEAKFERDIEKIFKDIDSNKEKIRTVEEKERAENRVILKEDGVGSENFFRKNVLQRFNK